MTGNRTVRGQSSARIREVDLRRQRFGVTMFFAVGGFLFAGWAVRIPAIKSQVEASLSALGLALLAMTAAAVATMAATGWLCARYGNRRVLIAAGLLLSMTVVPPTLADTAVELGMSLVPFGAAFGAIDVAVNSVAVDVIAQLRRPVMPALHAANSIGSLAGAGSGALLAQHLTPLWHMLLTAPLGLVMTLLAARLLGASGPARLPQHQAALDISPRRLQGNTIRAIGLFGVIGFCAAYSQGGLDGWVPLHLTASLDAKQTVAAAGYAIVQGALVIGRLTGARLLERWGQTRVLVAGGLISTSGTLLVAWTSHLGLAMLGLAATGLGLANIFPVAMARAGQVGGSHGVAAAATLGYAGIMLAPPTIGFLAAANGLSAGLTLIAALTAVTVAANGASAVFADRPNQPPGPAWRALGRDALRHRRRPPRGGRQRPGGEGRAEVPVVTRPNPSNDQLRCGRGGST
jgi:MFS family permease